MILIFYLITRHSTNFANQNISFPACDCFSVGITDSGYCNKDSTRTDIVLGQCNCKDNVFGRQCDECVPGYWGFRLPPGGHCQGKDRRGTFKIPAVSYGVQIFIKNFILKMVIKVCCQKCHYAEMKSLLCHVKLLKFNLKSSEERNKFLINHVKLLSAFYESQLFFFCYVLL